MKFSNYFKNKNIFTLKYKSKNFEINYNNSMKDLKFIQMKYAPLLTSLFYVWFYILDFDLTTGSQLSKTQNFHLSMIFVLLIPFVLSFISSLPKLMYFSLFLAPIYATLGNAYTTSIGMAVYLPDIYLIMVWSFVMAGFYFFEAIILNIIMMIITIIFQLSFDILSTYYFEVHIVYILIAFAIGSFANYSMELASRINFESNKLLEKQQLEIKKSALEIKAIHKHIRDSIDYASLIQQAILPEQNILNNYTKDHFIFWQPKDTVGGDIYFIIELDSKQEMLVMVIDGAGHGVPGAFITMLVKAIENQITAEIKAKTLEPNPALILEYFNRTIKTMLKQDGSSKSNAGFDGGVLYYNKSTNICTYAGAKTPLYIINDNQLEVIQSDRKNVGFKRTKIDQEYTLHNIEIKENTKLYIATDGIIDQEGENDTRYGKKEFERMILRNSNNTMQKQKENIIEIFEEFKSDCEQSDDITIVGLKIS